MMYLWEAALAAKEEGIPLNEIEFLQTPKGNGYGELALSCFNQTEIGDMRTMEINTYYRFYSMFKDMFSPDLFECPELRKSLTNVILHQLAENDVRTGMTKDEYYKKMLVTEMIQGTFGKDVVDIFHILNKEEQSILLNGWLRSYRVGSSLSIFTDMIQGLIEDSVVYHNNDCPDEIVIYTRMKKTTQLELKIQVLVDLFLEIHYQAEIFYEYHFGIVEMEDTMLVGEIAIY